MWLLLAISAGAAGRQRPNVTGKVSDEKGRPLAGVCVSDGEKIVRTDRMGRYSITSTKGQGFVFVSLPSGYAAPLQQDGFQPAFWQRLSKPGQKRERHDFKLESQAQDSYHVIFLPDLHIIHSKDHRDMDHVREQVMPLLKRLHGRNAAGGEPVYIFNLGDISQDVYWYKNDCTIDTVYNDLIHMHLPAPMFSIPGNHDNDPAVSGDNGDRLSEEGYRRCFGPTWYSVNIGRDHWVMLDNTIVTFKPDKKNGGKPKRAFEYGLTAVQMRWLEKDLETVPEGFTVRVCAHASFLFEYPEGKGTQIARRSQMDSLAAMFSRFDGRMHAYTGHTHRMQFAVNETFPQVEDLMLPAASGNVWGSGEDGLLGIDASDAGLVTGHFAGGDADYEYDTYRFGQKWMRCYDMNSVSDFYRTDSLARANVAAMPMRTDYSDAEAYRNWVYANIWMYRPGDRVVMLENGRELQAVQLVQSDPLMLVSPCYNPNTYIKPQYVNCYHLFGARTVEACSDVTVRIYAPDGSLRHEEIVHRPKAFSSSAE